MADFSDHGGIIKLLEKAQEAEKDVREKVREVYHFLNHPQGQWEDDIYTERRDRPRYTFDRCNDIVDDIAGEMEQADFDIKIKPAGGDATKDLAKTYDGLIRNIENLSNATDVFNAAGRAMVAGGYAGWRVNQRWGDNNTFDQDLYIDTVNDFVDRVWFDYDSVLQTREDANWCFVLQSMSREAYKEQFPEGSGMSVGDDRDKHNAAEREIITVGEFLWKEKVKRRIVEMSNGAVYVDDEKYQAIKDELAAQGVTEKRDRMREMDEVKTRIFDGNEWLTEVQDTVFDYIPVIPTYGNFSVSKAVPSYWGIITKKMDAQRIYNYSESRKIEETALSPLDKIVYTTEQVAGHEDAWENLNTSADPGLPYNHDPNVPPPYKIGGPQLNPGLETVSQSAAENLQSTAGIDLMTGQPPGLQSGLAVELKQNKGDTRNFKYSASQERAICHTAKILTRAIPKVYDTERQVRIINEDKSFDMVTVNQRIIDEETQKPVIMNDLAKGLYDVTCDVGPAFKNRQTETVDAFKEIAEIDPSIIEEGKDVWYGNLNAPGFDLVAERVRQRMLLNGQIPEDQMTPDEIEFLQNQPEPEPDPVAEALEREADNNDDKIEIEGAKLVQKDKEIALKEREIKLKEDEASMSEAFDTIKTAAESLKALTSGYKDLADAMGVEGVNLPGAERLAAGQAEAIRESQQEQP